MGWRQVLIITWMIHLLFRHIAFSDNLRKCSLTLDHYDINSLSSVGVGNLYLSQGQGNEDVSKRRRGNHSRPLQSNERKTRLSWEAHPSLLLHDLMSELDDLDHDHYISNEDEDVQAEESI